jgi:hypothetical protein
MLVSNLHPKNIEMVKIFPVNNSKNILLEIAPASSLPIEYGGTCESVSVPATGRLLNDRFGLGPGYNTSEISKVI